jgi:hypothetical protein
MLRLNHRTAAITRIPALLTAAAALAAPAAARPCTWSIGSLQNGFVPDFDQKRQPGPLFWDGSQFINIPAGLPGNGSMYCSPTSHINWMAYFANHGFPALMQGGSSPSWQSQSEYENVTASIAELGIDMETDPSDGTLCCGTSGMIKYLDRHAPNKFTVSAMSAKQLFAPSLADLAFCVIAGGYVCPFIGWYDVDSGGPNQYYKDGGHVITMVGLEGWCNGSSRQIKVRDPGSGDSNKLAQAAFATNTYTLEQLPGFFADNDGGGGIQVFYQRTHEKFVGYGSPGLLNGYRVILPKAGVTLSPLDESLSLWRPIQLSNGMSPPTHSTIGAGEFGRLLSLEPAAEPFFGIAHEDLLIGGQTTHRVWEVPLIDPAQAPDAPRGKRLLFSGPDVRSVASGRNRELYIISGSYNAAGGTGPGVPSVIKIQDGATAAVAIPSIMRNARKAKYSDATDSLILLDTDARKIAVFDADNLSAAPTISDLPSAVALSGEEYISISPNDGSMWIRSRNSNSIYNITFARNAIGGLTVDQLRWIYSSVALNGAEGLDVQGTSVETETILVTKNGVVAELRRNASGALEPATNSDFAGRAGRGGIVLTRSRTNHDASIMEGPDDRDVLPTDHNPHEWDCPGDANIDGVVSFADITTVLAQYGSTDETPADANASTAVDFGDITTVLANFGVVCR